MKQNFFWILGIVVLILGFFVCFFGTDFRVITGPDIITVKEGTQSFATDIVVGVANISNGSGAVFLSLKADKNTPAIHREVKKGDRFDFQDYLIEILQIKGNSRLFAPPGGSNGSITLKIIKK